LPTSATWHKHLAKSLRDMGFTSTMYDLDVWMIERNDAKNPGNDYIWTHTGDLMIMAKYPQMYMHQLQKICTIKHIVPPQFQLGCDYKKNAAGRWIISATTYVLEALRNVTEILGKKAIGRSSTPMSEGLKPRLDDSSFLDI
jgi:hypothetical protein